MLKQIRQTLLEREQESIQLLKRFVEIESFSHDKEGIDLLIDELEEVFSIFPLRVDRLKESLIGDHIRFTWGEGEHQITILSHLDTVYPKGTLENMPFNVKDGKVFGPGVYDMKVSYVMMFHLFTILQEQKVDSTQVKLVWLCTSDEEVGSPRGREHVTEEADRSSIVLVLEPSGDGGALKTARKGGGRYRLEVKGQSAHAGVNPQDGANAIEELAYQILQVAELADLPRGTTLNTGEIRGGTLFNVVPDYATAEVDVRVLYPEEAARIEQAFQDLRVRNPRTHLQVEGSIYRPPMVRTRQTGSLFAMAKKQAESLGISLNEMTTGGGSDGNFAAARGVPVLDGLGTVGGCAHSPQEFLWIDSISERTALLFGLIEGLFDTEINILTK